ncbi:uncharacterized protein CDV56_100104 [Aspergillus thermomutatus]|uniref:ThuA-like domain-containing protein n=1 Tax=Aspergillus thermomutatus TaxID=41047 RepID=A0A397GAH8_ASPTH|nr:uncharacterized protein CDV56_100104 [Aspergillus thermomutatus]RHZ46396.1 hypothetical protein CDV56_100104 [Aspergillus thermomutatus]
MSTENRPEILLLSLAYLDFLDEAYASLLDDLAKSTRLKRVKTANAALRYLEHNNPSAIIITDQGLTDWRHHEVLRKVETYVRYGGLAIIGLHFPSFVTMDVFDNFFAFGFGLPWKHGDYERTDFKRNPSGVLPHGTKSSSLPGPFSMKVLHVKEARPHEKIFIPVTTYSKDPQAAVTAARLGSGYLVYCGDVNGEEGTNRIIWSLCGLQV